VVNREEIIRMAREAGDWNGQTAEFNDIGLERFAVLVAAHEREKVAKWMVERGYATGHGDTVEDLLKELEWQAAEREREGYRQGYADAMNWKTQNHLEHLPGREWVGLTDEEIHRQTILAGFNPEWNVEIGLVLSVVRNLEAKLKEKNGG
jgi:hypothetical protein